MEQIRRNFKWLHRLFTGIATVFFLSAAFLYLLGIFRELSGRYTLVLGVILFAELPRYSQVQGKTSPMKKDVNTLIILMVLCGLYFAEILLKIAAL